jgi:hypothetical protein
MSEWIERITTLERSPASKITFVRGWDETQLIPAIPLLYGREDHSLGTRNAEVFNAPHCARKQSIVAIHEPDIVPK